MNNRPFAPDSETADRPLSWRMDKDVQDITGADSNRQIARFQRDFLNIGIDDFQPIDDLAMLQVFCIKDA